MPECSNPIQCQTAKREECTCSCGGANHGVLRKYLDSGVPEERQEGEEKLRALRESQATLKKKKRKERREKRAAARKAEKQEAQK